MIKITRTLSCIVALLFTYGAEAETYYVDQNHSSANDANAGSESSPWETIQHAADTLIAGDTVLVKEGVYTELSNQSPSSDITGLKPMSSGTLGNFISYEAYPDHSVIIDQQNLGIGFYIFGRSYIRVKGFIIRNIKGATDISAGVMTLEGSANIVVENNHIYNIDGTFGSNVAGIRFDWTDAPIARNNLIHGVLVNGVSNGNASGINSFGMKNALIENNEIYNAYNGIYHKQSSGETGALIKKNLIHDVLIGIFYDVAGSGNEPHFNQQATQNVIYSSQDGIHMNAYDASGINDNFQVWNNTISVSNVAIWVENAKNVSIFNNIIVGPISSHSIRFAETMDLASVELDYNNFNNAEIFAVNVWGDNYRGYNNLPAWQSNENYDLNSTIVDPKLVNTTIYNFKLQADSPMRDGGKSGENLGAYLSDTDVIGPEGAKPVAPKRVTNVVVE